MKVGLYIHDYVPVAGGGYTFQREIIRAISELSHQSAHQFSLLADPHNSFFNQSNLFNQYSLFRLSSPPLIQRPPPLIKSVGISSGGNKLRLLNRTSGFKRF